MMICTVTISSCILLLQDHSYAVTSLAFSPDGKKQIVSGSNDNSVRVWDAVTGTVTSTLHRHSYAVTLVARDSYNVVCLF